MSKSFINRIETVDINKLTELKKTNKLLCLYDSKINSLDKYLITSNKLDISILKNLTMFVSNNGCLLAKANQRYPEGNKPALQGSSASNPPIIILNKLNAESINLIKSDSVLKSPLKYNISIIFIGSELEYNMLY